MSGGLRSPGPASTGPATAVVPLRDGSGKTRLATRGAAPARSELIARLARHVLDALLGARSVGEVLVVTRDPEFVAGALPAHPRLTVLTQQPGTGGLNGAVALGHRHAVAAGARRVLAIHADLPLLAAADVEALLDAREPVVLAPDLAGLGTNALVLDAAVTGFGYRFGSGSRAAHAAQAAALGLPLAVVQRPGTATDLDTPADWDGLPAEVRARLTPASDRGGPRPGPVAAAG